MKKNNLVWLAVPLILVALVTAFSPLEKTLGVNARVVYLHGAWVWVALIAFMVAAAVGVAALLLKKENLHLWSRAIGRCALTLWISFFPLSLYVMQSNWNGLFFDEPRWRVPFTFAVTGLLLQIGLSLQKPVWSSVANIAFAVALYAGMSGLENVLHPISPVFTSESLNIQVYFLVLSALLGLAAWQLSRIWRLADRV